MNYAEVSHFEGYHFHHIGVWEHHKYIRRHIDRLIRG